jgi:hypothetical protein
LLALLTRSVVGRLRDGGRGGGRGRLLIESAGTWGFCPLRFITIVGLTASLGFTVAVAGAVSVAAAPAFGDDGDQGRDEDLIVSTRHSDGDTTTMITRRRAFADIELDVDRELLAGPQNDAAVLASDPRDELLEASGRRNRHLEGLVTVFLMRNTSTELLLFPAWTSPESSASPPVPGSMEAMRKFSRPGSPSCGRLSLRR